jgi:ornithine cyclodeaminase/alanine dehydrogenase-like protein (mu-crystallin family)
VIQGQSAEKILYLCASDVQAICLSMDSVALIEEIFRLHGSGQTILPDEAYLAWTTTRNESVRSLNMPSYVGGNFHAVGTKIINSNPANPLRGLPRASGLTLLFDPDSARIRCVMEASYLSALRTASVSVLAMRLLAGPRMKCLTVIGTGAVGTVHAELAVRTFNLLKRVVLFDVCAERAQAAKRYLSGIIHNEVLVEVASRVEDAVRAADVVVTSTTATSSYIPFSWLHPGAIVLNVSLDDLDPDVFLYASLVFVDDWNLVSSDRRRLLGRMYKEGRIIGPAETIDGPGARKIDGELGDLVTGRHPGRRLPDDIIVVNPFGLAIEDVALASHVFRIAQERGMGTHLNV